MPSRRVVDSRDQNGTHPVTGLPRFARGHVVIRTCVPGSATLPGCHTCHSRTARRALREIDESQGTQSALAGRETVYAGRILGMIASGLLGFRVIGALVTLLLDILA